MSAEVVKNENKDKKTKGKRKKWIAGIVGILALAGIGIGGYFYLQGKDVRTDVLGISEKQGVPEGVTVDPDTDLVTNGGAVLKYADLEHLDENAESVVYYTADITPQALVKVYEALGFEATGKVGVKLSTGEPPASNYLDPVLVKDLVRKLNATIVENNTAYGGSRTTTAMHRQVAEEHGFTAIADVDIMDEEGSMSIPVVGGRRLKEDLVGSHFANYDTYVVLSHFKGHVMAGFGGAIKNISIGFGSAKGKVLIHTAGERDSGSISYGDQDAFVESMAEAGKAVSDYMGNGERIVYVNVMNRLSIDCDCDGHPAAPDIHDIGIVASTDPVALDQACIDMVFISEGNKTFVNRVEKKHGLVILEHGEEIGLGHRNYRIVNLDEEASGN